MLFQPACPIHSVLIVGFRVMKLFLKSSVLFILILFIVSASLPNWATESSAGKFVGYLIDAQCMKAVESTPDALDFIEHHTKDCILMPSCIRDGYVLYLPKKKTWLKLDKKGNQIALKLLRKSKRNSRFFVSVKGKKVKSVLKVASIHEVFPDSKSKVDSKTN